MLAFDTIATGTITTSATAGSATVFIDTTATAASIATAADRLAAIYTRCLRKKCAKFFLSELRKISINFNNFW